MTKIGELLQVNVGMASKLSEKLCYDWSGDYESLQQFVKDNLNLEGVRSQTGGDRKIFTFDKSIITLDYRERVRMFYALMAIKRVRLCKS